MHRGEQQRDDAGAGAVRRARARRRRTPTARPAARAAETCPARRRSPSRAVPRRVVQRRRMPGPDDDEFDERRRNRRETARRSGAPDRTAPPATPSASSGAATATTPMCIVMCAENERRRQLRQRPEPDAGEREQSRDQEARVASSAAPDEDDHERGVDHRHARSGPRAAAWRSRGSDDDPRACRSRAAASRAANVWRAQAAASRSARCRPARRPCRPRSPRARRRASRRGRRTSRTRSRRCSSTAGNARPRSSGDSDEQPQALVVSSCSVCVIARASCTSGNPAITATVIDDRERDEVPVERDVRDVDVVPRGHAPGEPAREAVELHDHADRDVERRPDHEHPDDRGIDVARRIEPGEPRTGEQRRAAGERRARRQRAERDVEAQRADRAGSSAARAASAPTRRAAAPPRSQARRRPGPRAGSGGKSS